MVSRTCFALTIIGLSFALASCGYNTIPTLKSRPRRTGRRCRTTISAAPTSIPNLVATVQGYRQAGKGRLTAVSRGARQGDLDPARRQRPHRSGKGQTVAGCADALSGALGRLLAVSENYPDLKSNANFLALQSQLEGTENRIAVARRDYIDAVRTSTPRCGPSRACSGRRRVPLDQADGGVHRQRRGADAAAGEVLTRQRQSLMPRLDRRRRSFVWPQALVVALLAALWAQRGACAANFPPLTGRVVDQANILSAGHAGRSERKLADLEPKSGIQLVVATVTSLDGEEIEPYANGLFRAWKLGERQRNNGVLLLVAPKERRVRIEVGYGLEGTLTDAVSSSHHCQRDRAALQGRRFQRRRHARRRRHHHGAHHRRVGVAAAAVAAPRRPGDPRSVELAHRRGDHRARHAAHRVAGIPLVLLQRGAEYPAQFGRFAAAAGSRRGGFSGGGGSSGGGGASGSW